MRTDRGHGSSGWISAVALALGVLALTIAPSAAGAATTSRSARVISTAQDPKLGTILVAGDTVYMVKPSRTACSTTCRKAWLPVVLPRGVEAAKAGAGVDASKLGTASAAHGARQVTYAGKRLYWFAKDTAPGQVHGVTKNKWGTWSVVVASVPVPSTASPATEAPATEPPATEAPATEPPATSPPATEPPATEPPATSPPTTRPPATTSPGTGGVAF